MDHIDKLYYCSCRCGCTSIIASELHKGCTFCREKHAYLFVDTQWMPERKEIKLG